MAFETATAFPNLKFILWGNARLRRFGLWGTAALLSALIGWTWLSPVEQPAASVELTGEPVLESSPEPPAAIPLQRTGPRTDQLRVHGVLSTGAAFSVGEGRQRFVGIGREISPGIRLVSVQRLFVTVEQDGSLVRLPLEGTPLAAEQSTSPTTMAASHYPLPASATSADRQRQILDLRLGMDPAMEGDRIKGFKIRPNVFLPFLSAAGLRPGDVIISLNNEPVRSIERLMELPAEIEAIKIAKIAPPTIQYLRHGKIMHARIN